MIRRLMLTAGVVGPVLFVTVALIEGATRPGYSAFRNYVSDLALSSYGWMQVANFIVYGLLVLVFAQAVRREIATGRAHIFGPILLTAYGLFLIAAGVFVEDPNRGYPPGVTGTQTWHGTLHGLAGLLTFTTLAATAIAFGRRFKAEPDGQAWATYSFLTAPLVAVIFVISTAADVPGMKGVLPPPGLLQRAAIVTGWAWIAMLALRLLRAPRSLP